MKKKKLMGIIILNCKEGGNCGLQVSLSLPTWIPERFVYGTSQLNTIQRFKLFFGSEKLFKGRFTR